MSGIWQMMRGALEDVVDWESPLRRSISADQQMMLEDGTRLYVLGVSPGIGTCSRVQYHGRNILVLGLSDPRDGRTVHPESMASCQHVALIRDIKDHERPAHNRASAWVMAERLNLVRADANSVVLSRPNVTQPYVNT